MNPKAGLATVGGRRAKGEALWPARKHVGVATRNPVFQPRPVAVPCYNRFDCSNIGRDMVNL
jgi:hypothetical protein